MRLNFTVIKDYCYLLLLFQFEFQKLPDYDFQWNGVNRRKVTSHNDINVNSVVLNLNISYKWRPFVDDMMNDLHLLTTGPTAPTLVIMGLLFR